MIVREKEDHLLPTLKDLTTSFRWPRKLMLWKSMLDHPKDLCNHKWIKELKQSNLTIISIWGSCQLKAHLTPKLEIQSYLILLLLNRLLIILTILFQRSRRPELRNCVRLKIYKLMTTRLLARFISNKFLNKSSNLRKMLTLALPSTLELTRKS